MPNYEAKLHLLCPRGVSKDDVHAAIDKALAAIGVQMHDDLPPADTGRAERIAGTVASFVGVCEVAACDARAAIGGGQGVARMPQRPRGGRDYHEVSERVGYGAGSTGSRGGKGKKPRRIGAKAQRYVIETWDNQDGVWEPNGSGLDLEKLIKRARHYVPNVDDVKIVNEAGETVWSPEMDEAK